MPSQKPGKNNNDLMRYAGLGTQLFVSLALAVFIGFKADKWLHIGIPLFSWLLPLAVICVMIYQLIKDTSKRTPKNDKK
jgi:hypothetical protein